MSKKDTEQGKLDLDNHIADSVEHYKFDYEPIQGYPELRWRVNVRSALLSIILLN